METGHIRCLLALTKIPRLGTSSISRKFTQTLIYPQEKISGFLRKSWLTMDMISEEERRRSLKLKLAS